MKSNNGVYMRTEGMETLQCKQMKWQLAWLLAPLATSLPRHKHPHAGLKSHIPGQSTSEILLLSIPVWKKRVCVFTVPLTVSDPIRMRPEWCLALGTEAEVRTAGRILFPADTSSLPSSPSSSPSSNKMLNIKKARRTTLICNYINFYSLID